MRCHFNLQNIMQKYWQNFFCDKVEVFFFLLIFSLFDVVSGVIKSVLMDIMAKGASTDANVRTVQSE